MTVGSAPPAPPPAPAAARPAAARRSPRGSSENFGLLRSALILGLVLGIPTFIALLSRGPIEAWHPTARLEIHGDTWDGNLATDGARVYLMTREEINGFWGVLYLRSSSDGGRTWGQPVHVSASGGPSAARHVLAVSPDGSVWAAWAEQGAEPSSQQLMVRRSRDAGRTWDTPHRASQADVGLVGLPVLVITQHLSFVAFTNGETGIVNIQPLDADGMRMGGVYTLDKTTRQLYDDAPFFDAGLGAAAVNGRGILVGHDGQHLWRATQQGPGWPWLREEHDWYAGAAYAPPRLSVVDGRLTALATVFSGDGNIQISSQTSSNGGVSWDDGATWHDRYAGEASLAVSPDHTAVLWESCDQFCNSSILRLGDVEASNGRSGRIDGPAGRPAGALLTADSMIVAWITDGPDYEPEQRTVVVATGPRP